MNTDSSPDKMVDQSWAMPGGDVTQREPTDAEVDDGVVSEALSAASSGKVFDACVAADDLVELVTKANQGSHAVVSIALLPLIARAAALRADLRVLLNAIEGS